MTQSLKARLRRLEAAIERRDAPGTSELLRVAKERRAAMSDAERAEVQRKRIQRGIELLALPAPRDESLADALARARARRHLGQLPGTA